MAKIKIMLVDDQALFREGLKTLLNSRPEFEVVGEASNGEEAIRLAHLLRPQVILMDLRMPVLDGVQATRRIRSLHPDCNVIVLTTFDDDEDVFEGLRAGAIGYLLKDVSSEKLFEAIRSAARGEYFLLPSITAKVVAEFSRLPRTVPHPAGTENILSPREIEVLRLVATGISNKEIAERLFISEGTVKNHLSNILSKLNVKDRLQAVIRGRELGILP
ncbi:response regulator transcription factor [Thermanaerothrix sp.]|jgi:DNA-binding NarL/FixJ family response regulator|uniref:response regulator transcription factor n=1 Tax=Thermanaerothrix sp. TaxID=2972675 RepID=UPI002ADD8BFB|nr:response regulator transcription factor [Thermanaerothrix sp.]